ncbi:bifunctional 3-(3-hydroxy-phenyl)propionate/3-hydroxycinnamic acid hydroxylase [Actinocorallia sp. A-T 12471]|uniref:bifunctional 3-(3-hydroxy-phenyl)propionate/3-hydroxycinnamic acid hydroxylase MhpA n=1 Tax=Actinocorallia sp. A-T 12471 TaxID=3089813 RepID=UPI0029D388FA|nr:bifunctional 3-(3-hydroxy-phenyl)propionate/3-hydroxycinnamic acid hydroxylase [Actinocorallia sp. A-T 12471]MDX6740648.1 bifunctional 3-(3-hydroxy-phenyl)propionate/3-hydroxycinnamic acid hydroxylase [Actinocorallia sp. A-T 12471]
MNTYDVAVVGYGPSGVTAANFLGQYGIRTVILERDHDVFPRARAVTVDDFTLRLFQTVGLDAELRANMDPKAVLRWKTYAGRELLRTCDTGDGRYGQPASSMIFQPALEKTLRAGADRFGDVVDIRFGQEFRSLEQDADGVTLTAADVETGATSTVRAKYVIACDGGASGVRERLGIPLEGSTDPQQWVIIDAKVKRWWPERDLLTFWSDPARPAVDIPLALDHHRWELPIRADEPREKFADPAHLWELLRPYGVTPDHVEILHHAFYLHHTRRAARWREGRVLLAGDAAHMMPPWAGQGMQSGIRDAHNLAWKLAHVVRGTLPESVLDTYEVERGPHVAEMTKLALGMGVMIESRKPAVIALRNTLLPLVKYVPGLNKFVGEFKFKPLPSVKRGFLTGAGRRGLVGKMIPQPRVALATGSRVPLDDALGDGFAVLGLDADPRAVMSAADQTAWAALGARFLTLRSLGAPPRDDADVIDHLGVLAPWMRAARTRVVVLRPDRFVVAADPTGLSVPA